MRGLAIFLVLALSAVSLAAVVPGSAIKEILRQKIVKKLNTEKLQHSINIQNLQDVDPNTFIDQVLVMVDELIVAEHLDPLELVNTDVVGIDIDVWISGYSTMVREGDASIINADDTIDITCSISMNNIAGNISFAVDIIGIKIDGGATATIESIDIKLALRFVKDATTGALSGFVDDLQVYDIGTVTVSVFGLGPFDYLVDVIADLIVNVIKYVIPLIIDGPLANIFQQVIDAIIAAL